MKLKILSAALVATLVLPLTSFAAIDRAAVVNIAQSSGNEISASGTYMDGGVVVDHFGVSIPVSSVTSTQNYVDAFIAAIIDNGTSQGYSAIATSTIFWPYPDPKYVNAQIAAATSSLTLPQAMSFATPTRSLNSAFQVSSTRAAFVSYTVDVATTLSLTGGATGTVTLQYADDSGFTTNVKTVQSSVNGNTGTLTIGLALTQTGTAAVTGVVPAGKYVKIVTANTAGTPTFTYRAAQEVLMPSN